MIGVRLEPVDTWFFRDGTPFSAGSAPQDDVGSLVPPNPTTVVGALRAALALSKGWNRQGRWPRDICEVLGDGPEDLGALSLDGPFLLRDAQPLFRAPRHLFGSGDSHGWNPCAFLRPGPAVACDLGDSIRLPAAPGTYSDFADLEASDNEWLTQAGMNAVLRGKLPAKSEVVSSKTLWKEEPRIGLKRDISTRAAEEGMLYSTRHVRPQRGVSLGARIAGLPQDWALPFGQLVSLGGEGRLAECRKWNAAVSLDMPLTTIRVSRQVVVIALSPLDIEEGIYRGLQPLEALGDARVVSACLNRPQRVGGWDSLARRPLPLRCVLPPGSVLFCETPEPERFQNAIAVGDGLARVGSRQRWGFGLVALGSWPDE